MWYALFLKFVRFFLIFVNCMEKASKNVLKQEQKKGRFPILQELIYLFIYFFSWKLMIFSYWRKQSPQSFTKLTGIFCTGVFSLVMLQAGCSFFNKYTLPQVFSCKFLEIFKNTTVVEFLQTVTSTIEKRIIEFAY